MNAIVLCQCASHMLGTGEVFIDFKFLIQVFDVVSSSGLCQAILVVV